jgi:hypothetical protein
MLNLIAYGSMSSTPKPKHTRIEKRSMKVNMRFTQMDVRTLNGELENHFIIIFLCGAMQTGLTNAI